ncbi:MAG: acyl-CoA dehydrogenase family protein [Acidimicrobiales bacterium]
MDFQLTPEQAQVVEATARVCRGRFGLARLRDLEGHNLPPELWRDLVDAGFTSLTRSVEAGGSGVGRAEAVLVFEELGRSLVPGPLVWSHLWSGGDRSGGDLSGRDRSGQDVPGQQSVAGDGGLEFDGGMTGGVERCPGPVVVEHLATLVRLVVIDGEGVWEIDADLARDGARPLDPVDPLTPVFVIDRLPLGTQVGGPVEADRFRMEGALLVAAQQVGVADELCRLATEHARNRVQFNRPIGSFQAVKHLLAEMLVRVELARRAVYAAALHFDEAGLGHPGRAVAGCKVMAGEAAIQNGTDCIQVHGGMGFTWEVPAHLYLKRAWVLDQSFGCSAAQARALGAMVGSDQ